MLRAGRRSSDHPDCESVAQIIRAAVPRIPGATISDDTVSRFCAFEMEYGGIEYPAGGFSLTVRTQLLSITAHGSVELMWEGDGLWLCEFLDPRVAAPGLFMLDSRGRVWWDGDGRESNVLASTVENFLETEALLWEMATSDGWAWVGVPEQSSPRSIPSALDHMHGMPVDAYEWYEGPDLRLLVVTDGPDESRWFAYSRSLTAEEMVATLSRRGTEQ